MEPEATPAPEATLRAAEDKEEVIEIFDSQPDDARDEPMAKDGAADAAETLVA